MSVIWGIIGVVNIILMRKKIDRKNNQKIILEPNRLNPSSNIEGVVVNSDSELDSPKDGYYDNDEIEL